MAELKFIVDNTAMETIKNTELTANFDEMKAALTEFAEPYKNLIVSEDAISLAKADRAKIRSVSKHVDDYRKLVKRMYSEPLKKFEEKCKELTAICDEASDNIDRQIKEYERIRREEKIFLLKEYYDNADNECPDIATWDYLYDEHWENKTYSLDTAHKDIDDGIARIVADVRAIKAFKSEFELSLIDHYRNSHDFVSTLAMHERLVQEKFQRELAAKKKALEEEKAKAEQPERTEPKERFADVPFNESESIPAKPKNEPMYVATFKVYGSYDDMSMVRQFLNSSHIKYACDVMEHTDAPAEVALT